MIGKTLSHFRITAKVGAGGMGEVYRAEDTTLGREVALKVLPAELSSDPDRLARFEREAKTLAALDHPNIVTIHSVEEANGVRFLTMQLVEGKSLSELVPLGGMPIEEIFDIAIPLADALATAHEKGVIHRDLKPANIMVTDKGLVKVLDFGLAKLLAPASTDVGAPLAGAREGASPSPTELPTEMLTEEGRILGTMPYMSPEQLEGRSLDARTDVFSLGVILYEMATGQRPFQGDTSASLISSIMKDSPHEVEVHRQDLPRHLCRIIEQCLEKVPDRRIQASLDVRNGLEALRKELASKEEPAGGDEITAAAVKPPIRWWAVTLGALVMLALSVALNVGGLRDRLTIDLRRDPPAGALRAAETTLAVLPFQNLSRDPENEHFGLGMTAELISRLSRIQSLELVRAPREWPEGAEQDIGARYVLEGSVRRAGESVRITAQLIDTVSGRYLWSDQFDGVLEDVLSVQEDTALKIASALDLHLTPEEEEALRRRPTEDSEAYDAFLRGWALTESFHVSLDMPKERLDAARQHFEKALDLDPDYPLALAGLSVVGSFYYLFGVDRSPERLQSAEDLARQALALDPELAEGHEALGGALEFQGDHANAILEYEQAVRLDPKSAVTWCHLAWACNSQDPPDLTRAEVAAREAIRLRPGYFWSYYQLGTALRGQERYEEAVSVVEYALQLNPAFRFGHRFIAEISSIHASLGDTDKALAELERALAGGYRDFAAIDADPHFDSLRNDPRFQALLEKYGQDGA